LRTSDFLLLTLGLIGFGLKKKKEKRKGKEDERGKV
jgi:hypothetical protein